LLDCARDLNARGDIEFAKDVSHVGLDRLRAEKERLGDLRVRVAIDDEPRDLKFARRQRLDAGSVRLAGWRASVDKSVDVLAEPSQLALGRGSISKRATGLKLCRSVLQVRDGTLGLAGLREGAACERPRHGGFDRHADLVRQAGRGKRAISGDVSIPGLERDSRGGSLRH